MSVYSDYTLANWARENVHPFDAGLVNPASYDLRLSDTILVAQWYWQEPILRRLAWKLGWPKWRPIRHFSNHLLRPGEFVLCSSLERVRIPNDAVAILFSKSSVGRRGIEHLHAGYVDPGWGDNSHGGATLTWELKNEAPWPNLLVAGQPLMQLVIASLDEAAVRPYKHIGHYNEQCGPTPEIGRAHV